MKEQDYINATNLAKLRIADRVLRDVNFYDQPEVEKQRAQMVETLYLWIMRLEGKM